MKQRFKLMIMTAAFPLVLLFSACGNESAQDAKDDDTISTFMEPKEDHTDVKTDTAITVEPQDSLNRIPQQK